MAQWSNMENVGIWHIINLNTLFRNGRVCGDCDDGDDNDNGDKDSDLTLVNLNCNPPYFILLSILQSQVTAQTLKSIFLLTRS